MGVLYHRKSPIDHLLQIRDLLRPGGELVLETLVVEGDENTVLVPEDRLCQNGATSGFSPRLRRWKNGFASLAFTNVRTIDINQTSIEEQRTTDWMRWESLENYLAPDNPNNSFEGYPAPLRAILLATAP